MDALLDFLSRPWHWAVSGCALAFLSVVMTLLGRRFGISGLYNAMCTAAGAGKRIKFFDKPISSEYWRFIFVAGAIIGGFLAMTYLSSDTPVQISEKTIHHLETDFGWTYPDSMDAHEGYLPEHIFNIKNPKGIALALIGGLMIGFGTRYGEGCTSGHAINGLSHLQLPSLLAVIGFFIGGLIMTHLILPFIF